MDKNSYIADAVAKLGGPVATAREIGVESYQTIQQWVRNGNVPPEYAPALERLTGVSRCLLNRNAQRIWPELVQVEREAA